MTLADVLLRCLTCMLLYVCIGQYHGAHVWPDQLGSTEADPVHVRDKMSSAHQAICAC